MTRSIILSTLLTGLAALGIVACGGSDDGSGASAARSSSAIVSVANVDGTDVLTDSGGKTVYSAAVEKGKIRCVDGCTSFWDPVPASSADAKKAAKQLDASFGVVKRPDGQQQLTFDGLPLYSFAEEDAGNLKGDGFVDDFQGTHFEWKAARTSGGSSSSGSSSPSGSSNDYGY